VLINAPGAYTVSDAQSTSIYSLGISAGAKLSITAGTFTTWDGTASSVNAGTVAVGAGATFVTEGIFAQATGGLISAAGLGATINLAEGSIKGGKISIASGATFEATQGSVGPSTLTGVAVADKGTLLATGGTTLTLANTSITDGKLILVNTKTIKATGINA
jgi:hypothetical protein